MSISKTSSNVPREQLVKKKFLRELKKIKGLYYFTKEAVSIRGIPDVIVFHKGMAWGCEIKRDLWCLYYKKTGLPRIQGRQVLQSVTLEKINKTGNCGIWVYPQNMNQVLEAIKKGKPLAIPDRIGD